MVRPSLAPGPLQTDPVRKMVQNAPEISPGDNFEGRFVTLSAPPSELKSKIRIRLLLGSDLIPKINRGDKPPTVSWADFEGPQIYHICFYLFAVGPKNTKYPRMGLIQVVSGSAFWCNLRSFSSRDRFRVSRGPPWAPRGRKSAKNPGRSYHFILPNHRLGIGAAWAVEERGRQKCTASGSSGDNRKLKT